MTTRNARLILMSCATTLLFAGLVACGGGGDDDNAVRGAGSSPTPFDHDPGPAPALQMPVSRYSISQEDLGRGYITDIEDTWVLDAENYGASAAFATAEEGVRSMTEWGYIGGYETSYTPEGRTQAVLRGAYTIKVESHLFRDEAGAKAFYDYFQDALDGSVSERLTADPVGNESAAWRLVQDNGVPGTSVDGEFHRFMFRRGNLVAVVATWGAEPFMDILPAYELAHLLDEKALGNAPLIEPTPIANTVSSGN